MDLFDIDALDFQIKEYKKEIISKLHQEKVTEKNMKNSSDLICQVLDFSPKTIIIIYLTSFRSIPLIFLWISHQGKSMKMIRSR